jgi:hypothetical protein
VPRPKAEAGMTSTHRLIAKYSAIFIILSILPLMYLYRLFDIPPIYGLSDSLSFGVIWIPYAAMGWFLGKIAQEK